jgi:hypothetical protein
VLEFYGADYEFAEPATDARFAWLLTPPAAGRYAVQACWSAAPDRSPSVSFRFGIDGGPLQSATVNQTVQGGQWVPLGSLDLAAGQQCRVEVGASPDGVVIADATRLVLDAG